MSKVLQIKMRKGKPIKVYEYTVIFKRLRK
jgi:hypothetical protein